MALRHASPHTRPLTAALLGLALLAPACSAGDNTEKATSTTNQRSASPSLAGIDSSTSAMAAPSTSAAPTSSTAPSSPDAELTAAVRAFWDVYLAVGASADPFSAEATRARLAERSTGASLDRLLSYFSSNAASGYVVLGAMDLAPTVVAVEGDTAQVRDCYDDTTGLYRTVDGSRVDTDNPLRHQVLMTLVRENGVWKVSAISDEGDGCSASG